MVVTAPLPKSLCRLSRRTLLAAAAALVLVGFLAVSPAPEAPVVEHLPAQGPVIDPPLYYVRPKARAVALTFDISWGHRTLPPVLAILKREGVRATFFLSGPWAEHNPDLVRAIVAGGHEVASHGHEHVNLSQYDATYIRQNIERTHAILTRLSGQTPRFFRPPNGDFDDVVVRTARSLGYETVIWAVDSLDWKNPGADYMVQRVRKLVFPGAIVLFHASDSSRQVHAALPAVIADLKARKYRFLTLGDLYRQGEPGRVDPRGDPDYPPVREDDVPPHRQSEQTPAGR